MAGSGEFARRINPFIQEPKHGRGIFEEAHFEPGVSRFLIYSCGRLIEERRVATRDVDAQTWASMNWTLEHHCPSDPIKHDGVCSDGHRKRLRVLR